MINCLILSGIPDIAKQKKLNVEKIAQKLDIDEFIPINSLNYAKNVRAKLNKNRKKEYAVWQNERNETFLGRVR